jgi:hypothetical protein
MKEEVTMLDPNRLFEEGIVTKDIKKIRQAQYEYEILLEQEIMLDNEDHYDLREDISNYEECGWCA